MKKIYLFLCGLMAIAFTACVNDEILQEDVQNNLAGQPITVTAYAAETEGNPVTRIDQGTEGTDITLSWSDDDKFSVIRGSENQTFTKATGDNIFEGILPDAEGSGDYYAVYPVTTATDCAEVPFDISNQTEGLPYLMYSTSATGESYQFSHAVAYLKVTFPETLKNTTSTIVITTPEDVKTDGTLNLTDGTITGGTKNTITKVVTFGNNTDVMFAIPAMVAGEKTLDFLVLNGENAYTGTLTGTEDAKLAGYYYASSLSLSKACYLPMGNTVKSKLSNKIGSATIIEFIAECETLEEKQDNRIGSSSAYVTLDDNTLKIHTKDKKFVFNQYSNSMFSGLTGVTTINFNNCVNTSFVTYMTQMFYGCSNLTTINNLDSFNTEAVTDMSGLFQNCTKLTTLDLSNFNTSNVTTMNQMFFSCVSFESINVSSFNTSNVVYMKEMFYNCNKLTSIIGLNNFNTSKVTTMERMFNQCMAFTTLDLSNFNTSAVTTMKEMFTNCEALETLNLSNFNTQSVNNMNTMFCNCYMISSLDLRSFTFNAAAGYDYSNMFLKLGQTSGATNKIIVYVTSEGQTILVNKSTGIDNYQTKAEFGN